MRSGLTAMLVLVVVGAGAAARRPATEIPASGEIVVSLPDAPGPYCLYGIEKRLVELPEVAHVLLRWDEDEIGIELRAGAALTREQVEAAIERAEYPYPYTVEL